MHKQIQIAPGVYVTDFRKNSTLVGLAENQKKKLTNDVGLLLDQVQSLENKIKQLLYSINEIKSQQNWQKDGDFVEAVEQNWQHIVKFSCEMKQAVLRLYELKYCPESEKVEELLKIHRIEEREKMAQEEVKKNILKFKQRLQAVRELAKVEDQCENKQTEEKEQEDQGVYV